MAVVPHGVRGVLFDMDGVLAENGPYHARAWQEIFLRRFGIATGPDDERFHGGKSREIIQAVTGQLLPPDEAWAIHLEKEALYRELARGHLKPVNGVEDYVDALRRAGVPVGLVTSADRENVDFVLGALGLEGAFDIQVLGSDVTAGKPDPAPYRLGVERLALPAEACLAHEDSRAGVQSAVAAGCRVHAVLTTTPEDVLRAAGARWATRDFAAWRELLAGTD
ncbi:MAG TPA: HAD family phosphatase [Deinococcales bacterium]|nr:HAD family phosphatase [Deinococcales bacterium]